MFSWLKKMRKKSKDETPLMKNGRMLLEEIIASCNGKCNPIRSFSSKDLRRATNNYHLEQLIEWDADYMLYKGYLQDRSITVKRYVAPYGKEWLGFPIRDIAIGSQMSVHKNVLKLIGCCLETEHPILVYEFVGNQTLDKYIFHANEVHSQMLSWKSRVKVAAEIANAIAYLHTALSRPVIHRDIRPRTIILGENFCPKLIDFSLSIPIPEGESHAVDVVRGRIGYVSPEYLYSGYLTEKVDVFLFGVLLLQLLAGPKYVSFQHRCNPSPDHISHYVENGQLIDIVDPSIMSERTEQEELLAFAKIAQSCIRFNAEERPTMIKVAKELRQIEQSVSQ